MLIKDKKAIVTGGARGIGMEITKAFLNQGATVYIIDLLDSPHMSELEELARILAGGYRRLRREPPSTERYAETALRAEHRASGLDLTASRSDESATG